MDDADADSGDQQHRDGHGQVEQLEPEVPDHLAQLQRGVLPHGGHGGDVRLEVPLLYAGRDVVRVVEDDAPLRGVAGVALVAEEGRSVGEHDDDGVRHQGIVRSGVVGGVRLAPRVVGEDALSVPRRQGLHLGRIDLARVAGAQPGRSELFQAAGVLCEALGDQEPDLVGCRGGRFDPSPRRVEEGLLGEEGLVDDQQVALGQARYARREPQVPVSGDDDLAVPVGLAQPGAHVLVQAAQCGVARQAAVEADRRGIADLRVRLAALLAGQDVLGTQHDGCRDAQGEQERGYPYEIGAHRRGARGQLALEGTQYVGLERQPEHRGVGDEGNETQGERAAQGDRSELADPGQPVVEAEEQQGRGGHRGTGDGPERPELPHVAQQDLPERLPLEPLYSVGLGVEQDARAGHRHDGERHHEERAVQRTVRVDGGQLRQGEGLVDGGDQAEVGEGPGERVGGSVRSEDVVEAARIALSQLGDGVHVGVEAAAERGIAVPEPVGVRAARCEVEMAAVGRILEVGDLARDRRAVLRGEFGDRAGDLRAAGRAVGVRHPDDGGVSEGPVLIEAPEEQEGEGRGERQYDGVGEFDTSMQHLLPS